MSRAGILGDLAIPGDPAEIAALSQALRRTTDHVTECNNQLSAVSGNVDWRQFCTCRADAASHINQSRHADFHLDGGLYAADLGSTRSQ